MTQKNNQPHTFGAAVAFTGPVTFSGAVSGIPNTGGVGQTVFINAGTLSFGSPSWTNNGAIAFMAADTGAATGGLTVGSYLKPGNVITELEWVINITRNGSGVATLDDLRLLRSFSAVGANSAQIVASLPAVNDINADTRYGPNWENRLRLTGLSETVAPETALYTALRGSTGDGVAINWIGVLITFNESA